VPTAIAQQHARRRALAQLLELHGVNRQAELVQLLRSEGFDATQSSVSRDLKELGAVKLTNGYSLPEHRRADNESELGLIAEFVRDIRFAGANITVITTAVGAAQRVAVTLDRIDWPEIIGTLSGDDTIFVATAGAAQQRRFHTRLRDSLGKANIR
jgi:transcriptional regulator of arginine metabolism